MATRVFLLYGLHLLTASSNARAMLLSDPTAIEICSMEAHFIYKL
jgi:hypothetical protein